MPGVGPSLAGKPAHVQDALKTHHGDGTEARRGAEHEAELGRAGTYGRSYSFRPVGLLATVDGAGYGGRPTMGLRDWRRWARLTQLRRGSPCTARRSCSAPLVRASCKD